MSKIDADKLLERLSVDRIKNMFLEFWELGQTPHGYVEYVEFPEGGFRAKFTLDNLSRALRSLIEAAIKEEVKGE